MSTNSTIVLFDADGVLCVPRLQFASYLTSLGITRETTRDFYANRFLPCLEGKADTKQILSAYLPVWGWDGSVESFLLKWHVTEHLMDPDLLALISKLRAASVKVCLATNQDIYRARYMRESMKLNEVFDACFFSCELGALKPSKHYFSAIESHLNARPSELLFFDDEEPYVEGARSSGWNAYQYKDVHSAEEIINRFLK